MSKRGGDEHRSRRSNAVQGFVRKPREVRPVKRRLLIVGEGQKTEPCYFDALRREDVVNRVFAITVKKGHGYNQEEVVREVIEHKRIVVAREENYDEVWCVLDVESAEKREFLVKACKLADENGIKLCLSNPSFEFWFLMHFERKARAHADCDAVIKVLNAHWRKKYKLDYDKGDESNYRRLILLRDTAIANAEAVMKHHTRSKSDASTADCNASTDVYRLVRYLLGGKYLD